MIRENNVRKSRQSLRVTDSRPLAEGVYSLTLEYPAAAAPDSVQPGQFVGVFTGDPSALLMRPISVCEWDGDTGRLRLVYRAVGKGTRYFAGLRAGDAVDVLGVLGNGYDVAAMTGKRVLLLGGGIGAPPMLGLAKALQSANYGIRTSSRGYAAGSPDGAKSEEPGTGNARDRSETDGKGMPLITSVMGYRTKDLFLTEEFAAAGRLIVATDDGSVGYHGNAVDAARDLIHRECVAKPHRVASEEAARGNACKAEGFDIICACGPLPMLRAVKELARELDIPAYISLEERMACGIGACLGCVVRTKDVDGHSHVHNARICTEGPVFPAEEVEI